MNQYEEIDGFTDEEVYVGQYRLNQYGRYNYVTKIIDIESNITWYEALEIPVSEYRNLMIDELLK